MVIYRGNKSSGCVAITFDDGPNPEYTPKILDILKDKNVKVTFFLIGKNCESYPSVARRIVAEGHSIGNHTYTHPRLGDILNGSVDPSILSEARRRALNEVVKGAGSIRSILGISDDQLKYLRPPSLSWNKELSEIVSPIYSNRIIMTPAASEDWRWDHVNSWANESITNAKADEIASSVKGVESGDIIALHDGSEKGLAENGSQTNWEKRAIPTLKALPRIIDTIKNKGLKIVTLDEMSFVEEPQRR